MPANPQYDRVRQLFADQFEADGDGYWFRKNLKSPAIQVSADERDAFVAAFSRSFTRWTWGLIATLTVFLVALLAWALRTNVAHVAAPIYIGVGLMLTIFMAGCMRAWRAPERTLAARAVVAPERTNDEVKRLAMERLTWGRLGSAGASFAVALFIMSQRFNLMAGWNRLWLVLSGVAFAALAYRAFRKWRFERTGLLG